MMDRAAYRTLGVCLCVAFFSSLVSARGETEPLDPWSMSDDVPVIATATASTVPASAVSPDETIGQDFCFMLLRFYQKVLSVVTVSHCPMIPSCSSYGMDAVRKHGAFVGVMMTADRLYHEGTERSWAPIVRDGGRVRFLDPVQNNDFWWCHEKNRIALLLLLTVPAGPFARGESQDLSSEQVLAFADHLFDQSDYYRAITEYERFIFMFPDDIKAPEVELRIALCYLEGKEMEPARRRLRALMEKKPDTPTARRAALMLAGSYHAEGAYGPAAAELDQYLSAHPGEENADAVRLFDGMCHFQAGENELAREVLGAVASTSSLHNASVDLAMEMRKYSEIPRKSPIVAGALSAVLPGAGQVYVGRHQDAVLAFILNGVLIWAAYESFDNGEKVTGAVLSAVEAGWYFGNIYNAMNNAHKYNRWEH